MISVSGRGQKIGDYRPWIISAGERRKSLYAKPRIVKIHKDIGELTGLGELIVQKRKKRLSVRQRKIYIVLLQDLLVAFYFVGSRHRTRLKEKAC